MSTAVLMPTTVSPSPFGPAAASVHVLLSYCIVAARPFSRPRPTLLDPPTGKKPVHRSFSTSSNNFPRYSAEDGLIDHP